MPGFDRTGPEGQGSRTGRQMGKCANNDFLDSGKESHIGKGTLQGMGRGMGRGVGLAAGRTAGRGAGRGNGQGYGKAPGRNRWHN